jgi:hypothetical protein
MDQDCGMSDGLKAPVRENDSFELVVMNAKF